MGRRESRRLLLEGRFADARREGLKNGPGLDSWAARLGQSIAGMIACVAGGWWSVKHDNEVVAVMFAVGAVGMLLIASQLALLMLRDRFGRRSEH
jgi:hypothetical protein